MTEMTDLNLREKMTDSEKARAAQGAILEAEEGCLVEMSDRRFNVYTPETEEDAAAWKVKLGHSILIINPSYRVVSGVNTTNRYGKDKFTFVLDASGDVEEGYGKNDTIKGILLSVIRAFMGGKDNVPDLDPVHIMINQFELIHGTQARCNITQGESDKGTKYNNFGSWKIAS